MKKCICCEKEFFRTKYPNGRLEDVAEYNRRTFCSKDCYSVYNVGENHQNWKGGIKKRPDGYLRYTNDKYIHRDIMEKHLDRKLESSEFVHHIDGDVSNNNIDNLEILTNSKHRSLHCKTQKRNLIGCFA